jgi:hypothetical protein
MSTENNQPQVTNDEPVLVLDDKKYLIENLSGIYSPEAPAKRKLQRSRTQLL